MIERAKSEAEGIVAKAKCRRRRHGRAPHGMAEDKIAAEERSAINELRASAADGRDPAAETLIAERHDASGRRQAGRRSDRGPGKDVCPARTPEGLSFTADAGRRAALTPSSAFCGGLAVGFAGEVAQADDADQPFVAIQHRQAPNLLLAHPPRDVAGHHRRRARR